MLCPSCNHENQDGASFCSSCGLEFTAEGQCDNCHHRNPIEAQFCNSCGAVLRCPSCSRSNVGDGKFCRWCEQFLVGPEGVRSASIGRRVAAYILDFVLFFATLIIGYIIWWLLSLGRGQTPGKRLMGIRVMRADGRASDWGWTFIREFILKFVVIGLLGEVTLGIASVVDNLWAFWDKDRQALHDKVMKTVVVQDRPLKGR